MNDNGINDNSKVSGIILSFLMCVINCCLQAIIGGFTPQMQIATFVFAVISVIPTILVYNNKIHYG